MTWPRPFAVAAALLGTTLVQIGEVVRQRMFRDRVQALEAAGVSE